MRCGRPSPSTPRGPQWKSVRHRGAEIEMPKTPNTNKLVVWVDDDTKARLDAIKAPTRSAAIARTIKRGLQVMNALTVINIPQVDGATRLLAVTTSDAASVRDDRAMIDGITPLATLDIGTDGTREWSGSRAGRAAIVAWCRNMCDCPPDEDCTCWLSNP